MFSAQLQIFVVQGCVKIVVDDDGKTMKISMRKKGNRGIPAPGRNSRSKGREGRGGRRRGE